MSDFNKLVGLTESLVEAEKLRSEQEVGFNELMEASSDGWFDWRIQDNYEYMSPRFWAIFGYKPEEKEHSPSAWQDIIHPDDLKTATDALNKHVESRGKTPYKMNVRYTHKDGHEVTVICRGKIIEWGVHGEPVRMIGTHTDITK